MPGLQRPGKDVECNRKLLLHLLPPFLLAAIYQQQGDDDGHGKADQANQFNCAECDPPTRNPGQQQHHDCQASKGDQAGRDNGAGLGVQICNPDRTLKSVIAPRPKSRIRAQMVGHTFAHDVTDLVGGDPSFEQPEPPIDRLGFSTAIESAQQKALRQQKNSRKD